MYKGSYFLKLALDANLLILSDEIEYELPENASLVLELGLVPPLHLVHRGVGQRDQARIAQLVSADGDTWTSKIFVARIPI